MFTAFVRTSAYPPKIAPSTKVITAMPNIINLVIFAFLLVVVLGVVSIFFCAFFCSLVLGDTNSQIMSITIKARLTNTGMSICENVFATISRE